MEDSRTKPQFSAEEAKIIFLNVWGVDATTLTALPGYDDQNFIAKNEKTGTRWVLKFSFKEESRDALQFYEDLLERCKQEKDLVVPTLVPSVKGNLKEQCLSSSSNFLHWTRLLEWVQGKDWVHASTQEKLSLVQDFGRLGGRFDKALEGYQHPFANRRFIWRTGDASMLRHHLGATERTHSEERVAMARAVLHEFETTAEPLLPALASGVIHCDINDHNVLVSSDGKRVAGLLDFGDCCVDAYVCELGNMLYYAMLHLQDNAFEVARGVIKGYTSVRSLTKQELELVPLLAKVRCLVSVVMGCETQEMYPHDTYVGETQIPGWKLLEKLCSKTNAQLYDLMCKGI